MRHARPSERCWLSASQSWWVIACMPKIPPAFRGIERPNERSDTSVQSFDCALGSLAQASLDGMERQLDGVKIRRILRQESEACANTPESLLDPSNLVEGHIVSHHNVSMLERRRQTLLDVSQECFAVHGPLNEHRSHDASLAQASDERYRLPVPHWRVRDQAFSAGAPAVQAHHIGGDRCLVDKDEAGGIKPALLTDPASTRASHVGALALLRPQAFFKGDAMASEETRQCAAACRDTSLTQYRNELFNVRSRCSPIRSRICCEYFSNGDTPPPRGIGSNVPSF